MNNEILTKKDIAQIEKIIGYKFNNTKLLENAFIHSSYAHENRCKSNERLEFLGDSVLSIVVTDKIFHHYKMQEGDLSKIRASLVSENSLSFIMQQLSLGQFIKKGAGLRETNPTKAMQADAFEAIVAAIYLDGGLENAKRFVLDVLSSAMSDIDRGGVPDSSKSLLQERLPSAKINYVTTSEGQDNEKIYHAKVYVNDVMSGIGSSNKKKVAEELAAKQVLDSLKKV